MDTKKIKELRELTQAGILDAKKALDATNNDIEKAIIWLKENGLIKAAKKSNRVAAEGIILAKADKNHGVILEINSETDFVAHNKDFLKLSHDIADALLAHRPASLDAAHEIKLTNGHTVREALINKTATLGEKIVLRRFHLIKKMPGHEITHYNHANHRIAVLLNFKGKIQGTPAYNVAMHVAAMAPQYISEKQIPEDIRHQELSIIEANLKEDPKMATKPATVLAGIVRGKLSKQLAEMNLLDQPFALDEKVKVGAFLNQHNSELIHMIRYEVGEGIEKIVPDFASEVAAQIKESN